MAPRGSRIRRLFSVWNLILAAVLVFVVIRLAPHLGALVGIRSGPELAPEYTVTTLDGDILSADSLRGRVVLVNFWATWCLPCRAEMPLLESMWKRHRDDRFVLLGLSVDRTGPATVQQFVTERSISYPIAIVGSRVEGAFGGVRGIPTSFLLDRDGRIRHRVVGPLAPASLELAVRRLLSP